jgi:hypothetical protein
MMLEQMPKMKSIDKNDREKCRLNIVIENNADWIEPNVFYE